jgi:hypothetical protein
MHTTARPFLSRAARWPVARPCRGILQSSPFLHGRSKVAFSQRCSSTSTSSWEQPSSLRFTDLQEDGDIPSLRSILQAYPLDGLGRGPAWLRRLEHFLPASLQSPTFEEVAIGTAKDASYVRRGLLQILIATQKFDNFDILSHLGLTQQRWDVVAWVVKEVAQGHRQFGTLTDDIRATGIQWPTHGTLKQLTEKPFADPSFHPLQNTTLSLTRSTQYVADPRVPDKRLQHGGLGQIWRTMGSLILEASARPGDQSRMIMSHVLTMMAHLHHGGIVPGAVYKHVPDQSYVLQQPPILHMFSSRIMTALSEAAWNAHQTSASMAATGEKPSREPLFGPQVPGTRYNSQVEALSPEVWLELVLWSCLHGGWVADGLAVLEMMQSYIGSNSWSLVCWNQALHTAHLDTRSSDTFTWKDLMDILEGAGPQVHHGPNDHSNIARTISSESVAAYVDALTSAIYNGVGERGISAKKVISHLKNLKSLLDQQKLGLGYATWEAIVQRFAESYGVLIERDPTLMLEILELVQPYGTELESNATPANNEQGVTPPPYFFEASGFALGLFHRILQAHVDLGGVEGALASLCALQEYTDRNQRRSIEHFFQELKEKRNSDVSLPKGVGFFSIDYPAFFPQIPVDVLGSLLDLFTEAGISTSAIQLLQTDDLSGPIIPESFHFEPALAPALVRYATAANNKPMLEKVISIQSSLTKNRRAAIPRPILTALLASQITRHRWDSVHSVLSTTLEGPTTAYQKLAYTRWHPSLACYLASELLRIEGRSRSQPREENAVYDVLVNSTNLSRASNIFRTLLKEGYGRPSAEINLVKDSGSEKVSSWAMLHSVLGVLSSVNPSWATFCLPLLPRAGNQALALDTSNFNIILQGAVDGYGAQRGRKLCEQWCVDSHKLPAEARLPGGVERMSPVQPTRFGKSLSANCSVQVEIPNVSNRTLRFYDRVMPNLTTIRIVLTRVLEDEASGQLPYQGMLQWVVKMLNSLGYRGDEAVREISRVRESVEWRWKKGLK